MSAEIPPFSSRRVETGEPFNATGHFWAIFAYHVVQGEENAQLQANIPLKLQAQVSSAGQTIEYFGQQDPNLWVQLQQREPNIFAKAAALTPWYLTHLSLEHRLVSIEDQLQPLGQARQKIERQQKNIDIVGSGFRLHKALEELPNHIQTFTPFLTIPDELSTFAATLNPENETFDQMLQQLEEVINQHFPEHQKLEADAPLDADDALFNEMNIEHKEKLQLRQSLNYYDDLLLLSPEHLAEDEFWKYLVKYEKAPTNNREKQQEYLKQKHAAQAALNEKKLASLEAELCRLAPKVFGQRMRTSIRQARKYWEPINDLRQQLAGMNAQIDQLETEKAGLYATINSAEYQAKLDEYYKTLDHLANALVYMVNEEQRHRVAQHILTLHDFDAATEKPQLVEQKIPPISLEQLGIPSEDQIIFCIEALRWLGLVVDPDNVRISRPVRPPDYAYTERINPSFPSYELMQRLYLVSAFEQIQTDPLLTNRQFVKNINAALTEPHQIESFIFSFEKFMETLGKLTYSVDPTQEVQKQIRGKDLRNLSDEERSQLSKMLSAPPLPAFMRTVFLNFLHDTGHNILRPLSYDLHNIKVAVQSKNAEGLRQAIDDFTAIWQKGEMLNTLRYIVAGFQDEMIPGWGERKCDVRHVLGAICGSVAYRFNLQFSHEGEQAGKPNEPTGTIGMSVAQEVAKEVPISAGVIYRIVYNFIKNTAKAHDEAKQSRSTLSPLAIDILVRMLEGNLLLAVKDNGPGFDLDAPPKALAILAKEEPDIIQSIHDEVSPDAAEAIQAFLIDNHPYAIYPLTVEELFKLFLLRRLSGSIVREQNPKNRTSGIGLSAVREMIESLYKGSIWPTNHRDGGAFVMVVFPLEEDATEAKELLQRLAA